MTKPKKNVSLQHAIVLALRSGSAMALLAIAQPALAEQATECFAPLQQKSDEQQTMQALPLMQNLCIRNVHEGRAAVLLPDASRTVDEVAAEKGLSGHRWGFLDAQGQLVIKPIFDAVGDYHFGAAAARQKDKWGYIDPTGNWLIQPTFDEVQNFTQSGLAVVKQNGKVQIIDRKGVQAGEPLDELVDSATLSDGEPALLRLDHKTVLLSPDGARHVASDKMEILQPFGNSGLFIARDADKGYGIADQNLAWRVAPQFKRILLDEHNHQLALATTEDGITLIRADGSLDPQKYESVKAVTPQFWLAKSEDALKLLDNNGAVVALFDVETASALGYQGDYALDKKSKEQVVVYVPGRKQPLSLPAGSQAFQQDTGRFLITTKGDQQKVNAIVSPSGGVIGGAQAVGWLAQVADAEVIDGRLWLRNSQGITVNIVDQNGKALLTQKSMTMLEGYRIDPVKNAVADAPASLPVALVRPTDSTSKSGAGFVRAEGSLQLDNKWLDIQPAADSDESDDGVKNHYIVKTAQGTGVVDEQGKILIPLTEDNISPFVQGYALDYLNGKLTAIDISGKHYNLPDAFEFKSLGHGWFRYRETATEGALWGIYDVVAQKVISQPVYQSVGLYSGAQADVQLPNNLWGIVDQTGKTQVEIKYGRVKRINGVLWLLTQPAVADAPESSVLAEVIGTDAKLRIASTAGLHVTQFNDGRILATSAGGQSWLLDPQGNIQLHEQQTKISAVGDWIKLSRQPQEGYLSAQGTWQIAPVIAVQSSAFAKDRALRATGQGTELIDGKGVRIASMPPGQWYLPLASEMSISYDPQDDVATTRYVDATGKPVLSVQGKGSQMINGRAVLTRDDASKVWIDAQGNIVPNVNYSDLGLLSDGLAFAEVDNRYGFINAQGSFVVPPVFNAVSPFDSNVSVVSTDNTSMLIDTTGKPLARVDNECGIQVLYGVGSTRQWPQKMPEHCSTPQAVSK
ncbi:WG repeat-containing protein [Ewingella sp. S1.OA.A_B6]